MKVSQYKFGRKFRPEALLRNLQFVRKNKFKLRLSILKAFRKLRYTSKNLSNIDFGLLNFSP